MAIGRAMVSFQGTIPLSAMGPYLQQPTPLAFILAHMLHPNPEFRWSAAQVRHHMIDRLNAVLHMIMR